MTLAIVLALLLALAPAATYTADCPPAEESMRILGNPERFELRHGCLTVAGIAYGHFLEVDGEYHTWILVDPGWRQTFSGQSLDPVVIDTEMHTDIRLDPDTLTAIAGDKAGLPRLLNGERVAVTGALVYDRLRGYGRINPVWAIEER